MAEAAHFPTIIGAPNPPQKAEALSRSIGKTVASVEFGQSKSPSGETENEAIILYFTDGSSTAIIPGVQARDLAKAGGLASDLEVVWKDDSEWKAFDEVMGM